MTRDRLTGVVTEAFWAQFRSWAGGPGISLRDEGDVAWVSAACPNVLFNHAFATRFMRANVDRRIDDLLAAIRPRAVPFLWRVGPSCTPDNLGDRLLAAGFAHDDIGTGMARELAHLDHSTPPPAVTIEVVGDRSGFRLWTEISVDAFDLPDFVLEPACAMFAAAPGGDSGALYYIARLDGEPLAMGSLSCLGGVANIQNLATRPAGRRRGIATALVCRMLADARLRGCRTAVVVGSSMGRNLYRRCGFAPVCDFTEYLRPASG